MKYTYPAIFTREESGKYDIVFPDLDGCYTSGDDYADGLRMAKDVLTFTLYDYEKNKSPLPVPSHPSVFQNSNGAFVRMIACDTEKYALPVHNAAIYAGKQA